MYTPIMDKKPPPPKRTSAESITQLMDMTKPHSTSLTLGVIAVHLLAVTMLPNEFGINYKHAENMLRTKIKKEALK